MILDAIACGLVILWQLQVLIYRLTGISLYNTMKTGIEKEIAPTKVLSLKK